jgi:hypothetical protein
MSATTVVVVPAEKATRIEHIFEGTVRLGCPVACAANDNRLACHLSAPSPMLGS